MKYEVSIIHKWNCFKICTHETYMQVRKKQLEPDMEQQTGSN